MRIESPVLPVYAMELPDPSAEPAPAEAPVEISADSSGQQQPEQQGARQGRRSRLASLLAEHGHEVEAVSEQPVAPSAGTAPGIINNLFDSVNSLALRRLDRRLKEERKLKGRLLYTTEVTSEKVGFFIDLVA
ncbi:MAG: hypothetical protein IPJ84_20940 [Bdellovibrionales bacterium]|nr:hypothetical protein [Bdellovibrionales bacterium]